MAIGTAELPAMIGEAPAFRTMLAQVSRLAPLDRAVVVTGERGTGKELVAARLHYLSRRWDRPLVRINCAALADSLLDSALFGHEAGAFTGAVRRHRGLFERADGGTLVLDEIAAAAPAVQEKLLRAVEYGRFERVGGQDERAVDVRVIAASHTDLPALVRAGRFRADLLDRLAFDVVTVPPLRARGDDIDLLADRFAVAFAPTLGLHLFPGFTPAARAALHAHHWPGNVRELRNAVERSMLHAADPTAPLQHIRLNPFAAGEPAAAPTDFKARVAAVERALITAALAAAGGNQAQAASALGLGYHQFRRLVAKHGAARAATEQ